MRKWHKSRGKKSGRRPLKLLRQVYALFGRYDNKTFTFAFCFFFFVSASHATYLCFLYIYIYDGRRVFIVKYALYSSLSAKVLIMLECPEKKKNEIPGST